MCDWTGLKIAIFVATLSVYALCSALIHLNYFFSPECPSQERFLIFLSVSCDCHFFLGNIKKSKIIDKYLKKRDSPVPFKISINPKTNGKYYDRS